MFGLQRVCWFFNMCAASGGIRPRCHCSASTPCLLQWLYTPALLREKEWTCISQLQHSMEEPAVLLLSSSYMWEWHRCVWDIPCVWDRTALLNKMLQGGPPSPLQQTCVSVMSNLPGRVGWEGFPQLQQQWRGRVCICYLGLEVDWAAQTERNTLFSDAGMENRENSRHLCAATIMYINLTYHPQGSALTHCMLVECGRNLPIPMCFQFFRMYRFVYARRLWQVSAHSLCESVSFILYVYMYVSRMW